MELANIRKRQLEEIAIAKAIVTCKDHVRGSKEPNKMVLTKYRCVIKELKNRTSLRSIAKLKDV